MRSDMGFRTSRSGPILSLPGGSSRMPSKERSSARCRCSWRALLTTTPWLPSWRPPLHRQRHTQTCTHTQAKLDQTCAKSDEIQAELQARPKPSHVGSSLGQVARDPGQACATSNQAGPTLGKVGPNLGHIGPSLRKVRPTSGHVWQMLGPIWPTLLRFGQVRPSPSQVGHTIFFVGKRSTKAGPESTKPQVSFDHAPAKLGRVQAARTGDVRVFLGNSGICVVSNIERMSKHFGCSGPWRLKSATS